MRIFRPHDSLVERFFVAALFGLALILTAPLLASPVVALRDASLHASTSLDGGCAVVNDQLLCWGDNLRGDLGIGAPSLSSLAELVRPGQDRDFDRISSLAVDYPSNLTGSDRRCVVDASGVWCWGRNARGQLGSGDRQPRMLPTLVASVPDGAVEIAHGRYHACVRTRANGVWCWGGNDSGATGQIPGPAAYDPLADAIISPPQTRALKVPGLPEQIDSIALGHFHSCALAAGQVWCWGGNERGQLGDGSSISRAMPRLVSGLPPAIEILASAVDHSCAADGSGEVWCWGNNQLGEVGVAPQATPGFEAIPVRVSGLAGVPRLLSLSVAQSCALVGELRVCWGAGEGTTPSGPTPTVLARPAEAPSDWLHGCFSADNELHCQNNFKRYPFTPTDAREVTGLHGVALQLALGESFACARLADASVWCWGQNLFGELGQGDLLSRELAVRVNLPPAIDIAAGSQHACAATIDGLWCWGQNDSAELGDGSTVDSALPVRARYAAERVVAGEAFTCAYAQATGGVQCWGGNWAGQVSGQPSNPIIDAATPLGMAPVSELSAGLAHVCALLPQPDGPAQARCWGKLTVNQEEIDHGIVDYSPRQIAVGNPLPAGSQTLLRSAGFSTCAGDLCYGLNYLPPDRGQPRVDLIAQLPAGLDRGFSLGARLACAQGVGSDVRCAALTHRACAFESLAGRLAGPGFERNCFFNESAATELERDWNRVVGLPVAPTLVQAGEQYACAAALERVWCWGSIVPSQAYPSDYLPVFRAGALQPARIVRPPLDPARGCPAYVVSSVSLLEPNSNVSAGAWGQEILLFDGRRNLNGGLNFGGFGSSVGAGIPGYAAFSIHNARAQAQMVNLQLRGDGGEFDVAVFSTLPPSLNRVEVFSERLTLSDAPIERSLRLNDGFHIVVLQPLQGTRLFLAGLNTSALDGGPAAFQGGAVVGGYLSGELSGFSGICTDDATMVSVRSEARSSRGPVGAGDLRLRVSEAQTGEVLYSSD